MCVHIRRKVERVRERLEGNTGAAGEGEGCVVAMDTAPGGMPTGSLDLKRCATTSTQVA